MCLYIYSFLSGCTTINSSCKLIQLSDSNKLNIGKSPPPSNPMHFFFFLSLSLCFYSTCLLNCCLSTLSYIRNEVAIFNLLDAIAHEQKINTIFSPWKLKLKLISFHFSERTYTHSAFEIIALDEDLLCQPHNDNASDNNDNNIPLKQSYERKE